MNFPAEERSPFFFFLLVVRVFSCFFSSSSRLVFLNEAWLSCGLRLYASGQVSKSQKAMWSGLNFHESPVGSLIYRECQKESYFSVGA